MDLNQAFAISAAGMSLERTRVDVAALNLANANTVWSPVGQGYRPQQVVAQPVWGARPSFPGLVSAMGAGHPAAMPQVSIVNTDDPPRRVHDPHHPFADEEGFVSYPGIDIVRQMTSFMTATRAYEANVAAFNAAKAMAIKTLEIGAGGA